MKEKERDRKKEERDKRKNVINSLGCVNNNTHKKERTILSLPF
jgi:hypothetical protein